MNLPDVSPSPQPNRGHLPHWLTPFLMAGLFLLIHILLPRRLSRLAKRHGWERERPGPLNRLALTLVGGGIAGTLWTMSLHFRAAPDSFLEFRRTENMVTPGPYAYSRNPMYLFELTFWLGWALFYGSLSVLAGFLTWLGMFNFLIVPYEERELEERFGEPYRQFKQRVPRWLGRPRIEQPEQDVMEI